MSALPLHAYIHLYMPLLPALPSRVVYRVCMPHQSAHSYDRPLLCSPAPTRSARSQEEDDIYEVIRN